MAKIKAKGKSKSAADMTWTKASLDQRIRLLCKALPKKKMDQNKLKKLLETADPQDQIKLKVMHNAFIKCVKDYNEKSTSARLQDWRAAEAALEEFIDVLWAEHFNDEQTLPNVLAVVDYLSKHGWKVSKSTVYEHKKQGLIRPDKSGMFRISAVDKYASANLERLDGSGQDQLSRLQLEEKQAEIRRAKAQADIAEAKAKAVSGKYVEKEALHHELAMRASVFKGDLENFIHSRAGEIISLVEGNTEKIPDLITFVLAEYEKLLDRYAGEGEFRVPIPLPAAGSKEKEDGDEEEDE
jgi:hypothetical protein